MNTLDPYLEAASRENTRRSYASALRHMYVHGHLTASPQGVPAENIAMICNEISRSLLHWIKCDFERRLALAAMA